MKLSDERINYLSHTLIKSLKAGGTAEFPDETRALLGIKRGLREFGELLDTADRTVRQKIESLRRGVPEGSREWDLLYRQYVDEELAKKGL